MKLLTKNLKPLTLIDTSTTVYKKIESLIVFVCSKKQKTSLTEARLFSSSIAKNQTKFQN